MNSILRSQREVVASPDIDGAGSKLLPVASKTLRRRFVTMRSRRRTGQRRTIMASSRREKALARSAFRDATGYFQVAMDAVDKLPALGRRANSARSICASKRGLAFASLGNIEQWFELCRDAEARSEKIGDERRRLASIAIRAAALNFYGTPYEAITAGEQAVALADDSSDADWLGYAEYGLGQAYFVAGRYRDAEACLESGDCALVDAPENVPPGTTGSSLLVLCHMMKAMVHALMGEYDDSGNAPGRQVISLEENGLPYDIIAADYGRGFMQMSHGNLDEAETALDEALSLSRENEVQLVFARRVVPRLEMSICRRGQAAKARDILLEAREEADALGNSSSTLLASTYLASAHALLGDTSKGLEAARACQAGAKQKGYLGVEALAIFAEALILSLQGDAADAIARYERMIEIAEDLEAWPLQGLAKGALARLFAAAGRKSEAKDELEQAVELFARSKMTNQLERAKAVLSKFSDL